jgi:phosphatidylglycerol---prolipoprotein diacylglyceryl transferase
MNPRILAIPGTNLGLTWYGLSIVLGVVGATVYATRAARRQGKDAGPLWDMLIYVMVFGVAGARLWFVVTATLGGSRLYLQHPLQILNVPAGGSNIFGAIMAGFATIVVFCWVKKLAPLTYLDLIAPGILLGQALARWGNFANQELYGPPTTLPWGIPIDAAHRLPAWSDMARFPPSTRFHPTFLYETAYDLAAFALLMYLLSRLGARLTTGAVFGMYLILHGVGRFLIEFFRPDQPRIPGTDISYSRVLALLFVLLGVMVTWLAQRGSERSSGTDAEEARDIGVDVLPTGEVEPIQATANPE